MAAATALEVLVLPERATAAQALMPERDSGGGAAMITAPCPVCSQGWWSASVTRLPPVMMSR